MLSRQAERDSLLPGVRRRKTQIYGAPEEHPGTIAPTRMELTGSGRSSRLWRRGEENTCLVDAHRGVPVQQDKSCQTGREQSACCETGRPGSTQLISCMPAGDGESRKNENMPAPGGEKQGWKKGIIQTGKKAPMKYASACNYWLASPTGFEPVLPA